MGTQTYTIDIPDTIKPLITTEDGVTTGSNYYKQAISPALTTKVRIYFSEAMNATDLASKSLYEHGSVNPLVATPAPDSKSVYLEFAANVTGNLVVGPVKDLAGNSLGLATTLTGVYATTVGLDLTLSDNLTAPTRNTVKVYLSDIVLGVTPSDFRVRKDAVTWVTPAGVDNVTTSGKSVLTLTLAVGNELAYDAVNVQLKTVKLDGTDGPTANAKNQYAIPVSVIATAVTDRIIPALVTTDPAQTMDVDEDGKIDHIRIEFVEDMQDLYVVPDRFTVAGYTVVDAYASSTAPSSATSRTGATVGDETVVYIRVTEKTVSDTAVTPVITIASGLRDVAGNLYAGSTVTATDKAVPVIVSAVTRSANTVEITYSETVTNNNVTPTQYVFNADTTTGLSVSGSTVTLTLTTGGLVTGTAYPAATIVYTQSGTAANRTKDAATVPNNALSPDTLTGITSGF